MCNTLTLDLIDLMHTAEVLSLKCFSCSSGQEVMVFQSNPPDPSVEVGMARGRQEPMAEMLRWSDAHGISWHLMGIVAFPCVSSIYLSILFYLHFTIS